MSVIALTTKKDFSLANFELNMLGVSKPGVKAYYKDKIIFEGLEGCSVELYGKNLKPLAGGDDPRKAKGDITHGVFKIDGEIIAELSDLKADISSKGWINTLFAEGSIFSVLYALNLGEEFTFLFGKGDDDIEAIGVSENFLFGGAGDDEFTTSFEGADTYFDGGKGIDKIYYIGSGGKEVTVNLADPTKNAGHAKGDSYESIEDVQGTFFDDKLTGDDKANVLEGDSGADTISGGGGRDTLDGGTSFDENLQVIVDFVSYEGTPETGGIGAYVSLADGIANAHGVAGEVIKNFESVIGSSFRDRLIGDGKNNSLFGEDGSDSLQGGKGADTLRGDETAFGSSDIDQFIYGNANEGGDRILDYDISDQIGISRSGFGLDAGFAIVDGVSFIKAKNAAAETDDPTFLFNTKNNNLLYDADGTGSGKAVVLANVAFKNPDSLDASDFVLLF